MSDPTNAPENELASLRRRNLALVAKLEPIMEAVSALLPERRILFRLNDEAYDVAEAAAVPGTWGTEGEEQFGLASGRYALGEAALELKSLVDELEMPKQQSDARFDQLKARKAAENLRTDRTEGSPDLPSRLDAKSTGWIPDAAKGTDADVKRVIAESRVWDIRSHADQFRKAIADAHAAAQGVFLAVPSAYVDGLLANALLQVTVAAEEATDRLGAK